MTKIAGFGSGSISQRHGSADLDPDPQQNVMDSEHWFVLYVPSANHVEDPAGSAGHNMLTVIQLPDVLAKIGSS